MIFIWRICIILLFPHEPSQLHPSTTVALKFHVPVSRISSVIDTGHIGYFNSRRFPLNEVKQAYRHYSIFKIQNSNSRRQMVHAPSLASMKFSPVNINNFFEESYEDFVSSGATAAGERSATSTTTKDKKKPSKQNVRVSSSEKSNAKSTLKKKKNRYTSNHISEKNISKKQKVRKMMRKAKGMERLGKWHQACNVYIEILELDPYDSHSHLAYARLQSRRERGANMQHNRLKGENRAMEKALLDHSWDSLKKHLQSTCNERNAARQAFLEGTTKCPLSVHLWQAWALHEQSIGNLNIARMLFKEALEIDLYNPYVCHGFGLLEKRCGNIKLANELWEQPLKSRKEGSCSAALICSLGESYVEEGRLHEARDLYMTNVLRLSSEREISEVYLAAAWLEEKQFKQMDRAEELLNLALRVSPGNSRAQIALARLEGRRVESEKTSHMDKRSLGKNKNISIDAMGRKNAAVCRRLEEACTELAKEQIQGKSRSDNNISTSSVKDGRLFNAWANLEVKAQRFPAARRILSEGITLFPRDHSLLQSAGKVEERVGNITGARNLYSASLMIQPSAPTLVAYAMLETHHPESSNYNYTKVARLFDEALLLDPRHGPVYNAYGNMELRQGNVEKARNIFQSGLDAHCTDLASVYHGLARLELSLGNIETARLVLVRGLKEVETNDRGMDNNQHKRAVFLAHTLGMLEFNANRMTEAKAVFETGIKRHRNSSQLLLGAALCEIKLGNEGAARKLFEQAVHADRKHSQAWQCWGVMEMRAGNYNIAKTLFECGLKADPFHGALWHAYAILESRRGNFDGARRIFSAGLIKCSTHVPLYQAWACLEMRSDNLEKAKALIGEALSRDKNQGSGWLIAAKIEDRQGNKGLAKLVLQRGLKYAPNDATLYCAMAEYEVESGKIQAARDLLEKGLELDPLHAPLYHSLAELEARVFNVEGLARLNKRALKVFNSNALIPPPLSIEILRKKLRNASGALPKAVTALANLDSIEMVLDEKTIAASAPDKLIETMHEYKSSVLEDVFHKDESKSTGKQLLSKKNIN